MRQLTYLYPDGRQVIRLLKKARLEDLQLAVEGPIQIVPEWRKYEGRACTAYANEEGQLRGLPHNKQASKLWRACYPKDAEFWYMPELFGIIVIEQAVPKSA